MAEDKKEDTAKSDATNSTDDTLKNVMDAAMAKLDACMKRMDEWDEEKKKDAAKADAAKKDGDFKEWAKEEEKEPEHKKDGFEEEEEEKPERLAADKKKKDSIKKDGEEEEKEKEKMDAVKADAATAEFKQQLAEQRKVIEELTKLVRQPIADSDRSGLAEVQSRADSVLTALGEGRAPQPLVGESVPNYRRRMAAKIQSHSRDWKETRLDALPAEVFEIAEKTIYADATVAAKTPSNIKPGYMREVRRVSEAGHIITDFYGSEGTHFVQQFTPRSRRVRNINYTRP